MNLIKAERGVVLLTSLVFMLLLTLLGVSSLQNATLQEKMAGSLKRQQEAFQAAESVLRQAESTLHAPGFDLPRCTSVAQCAAPLDAVNVTRAGPGATPGVSWIAAGDGFFSVQHIAKTADPANTPPGREDQKWTVYRLTAVGLVGQNRSILESLHTEDRRILWRQLR